MPSPVAHSIISLALSPQDSEERGWIKRAFFWIILGNFADLDFIPGILMGDPGRFHHGPTHSILFALVLTGVARWLYPVLFKHSKAPLRAFLMVTLSHLFLDAMTLDTVAPYGLPLFWPFNSTGYRFPFWIFLNMNRGMRLHILFSWHNFLALCLEIALTFPVLGWALYKRRGGKVPGRVPRAIRSGTHGE